jgi:hypothetical protein
MLKQISIPAPALVALVSADRSAPVRRLLRASRNRCRIGTFQRTRLRSGVSI